MATGNLNLLSKQKSSLCILTTRRYLGAAVELANVRLDSASYQASPAVAGQNALMILAVAPISLHNLWTMCGAGTHEKALKASFRSSGSIRE